jgi:DNA polymerase I-like protein with 3'-5' exonuclease and polymerase domains
MTDQDIALLRAFLPQVERTAMALFADALTLERVLDAEWHSEVCECGRDLPDGELEWIGVGNDKLVVQLDWQAAPEPLRVEIRRSVEMLVSAGTTIYHNADADIRALRRHGFNITAAGHARLEDTMLADAVTDSEEDHDLGDLNRRHGRLPDWKQYGFADVVLRNACDVVGTYWVWKGLERRFAADPQAHDVYRSMSIPFIDLAIEGEEAGIAVDAPVALQLFDKYLDRITHATLLARAYTGDPTLNLASPEQLKWWVYGVYGMPEQRKRAGWGQEGELTLEKDALAELRRGQGAEWDEEDEPTLEQALENIEAGGWGAGLLEAKYLFGGAQQRLTHYVIPCLEVEGEGINRKVVAPRARVYPRCKIHGQASGRVGYVEPALPQMKGDTAKLFCPDLGTVWVGHDWSNIETWILGGLAGDELILEAKDKNWDTHTVNFCDGTGTPRPTHTLTKALHTCPCPACVLWRTTYQWLGEDDLRRVFFKRYIYRLHYRGLAKNAGNIPGARALKMDVPRLIASSEAYLAKHPALPAYWAAVERQADVERLARTFMGRPRRLTEEYRNKRNREACNLPMQGGVADIWITTALLVKAAAPWARLLYGAYDSMWWVVPEAREAEFLGIYAPIVERELDVCGRRMSFPAAYKIRRPAGIQRAQGGSANG